MNPSKELFKSLLIMLLLTTTVVVSAKDKDELKSIVLNRLFNYKTTVDTTIEGHTSTAYLKYCLKTDKKNNLLYCVPHLYVLAKAKNRSHIGEIYATLRFHEKEENEVFVHAKNSTVRRQRTLMTNTLCYLVPNIYSPTLISDHLLSPFNKRNKFFYKYKLENSSPDQIQISFRPKFHNTQAVKGKAIIDRNTGKVIICSMVGEYDMVSFETNLIMGKEGISSLLPLESKTKIKFSFMGNRIRAIYQAKYNMPSLPSDSIIPTEKYREVIEDLRPYELDENESAIYTKYDSARANQKKDTTRVAKKDFVKDILWDKIGDNIWNRIRVNFGPNDRGYVKFSPIFNPFYISYSKNKGLSYRMTIRAGYELSANSDLYTRTRIGYSFRLKQPYIDFPLTYTFNKERNGYVKLQLRSGERITTSTVVDKLKQEPKDSIDWDNMDLDYFRHFRLSLEANYDINKYLGFQTGIAYNKWTSIHDKNFDLLKKPTIYSKTAVTGELCLRPLGKKGPILTINYETTFKGTTEPGLNYEKWEFDCSYLRLLPCMRALSIRVGAGFYPTKTHETYFLDFNNFRDNNLPGGWNDDWSGEFNLLHSNWYNSSKYYFRSNTTYESPMLLLSRIPLVGTIIEKERIYFSALKLSQLKNYFEIGYGITNRIFSIGLFSSFKEGHYDSFGCELGFELFNRW